MKYFNYLYQLCAAFLTISMVVSCDYLEIVPPEQADLGDATKDKEATLGFLYSCYSGVVNPITDNGLEGGADEWVFPLLWEKDPSKITWDNNSSQPIIDGWRWGSCYRFIGQTHLFLQELPNAKGVTEDEKNEYIAEANFLLAYYHFMLLSLYGPCPITDSYIDQSTPSSEYNGRFHYDYVKEWICKKLDDVAEILPATRSGDEWGRATSVMAKALKARLLVYAASPLWNGSFPYVDWANKNFETPGYGKEIVSRTYDKQKWEDALLACREAIDVAEAAGHKFFSLEDAKALIEQERINLPYVPFKDENDPLTGPEDLEFKQRILLMRYLTATRSNQGNKEIIWGHADQSNFINACLPHRIIENNSGGWQSGWGAGLSPTLNSVIRFYSENGLPIQFDQSFYPESDWYKSAGAVGNSLRADIIKLNTRREPRFYAWIAFDGGDMGTNLYNGQPLQLDLKNSQLHGYNPGLFNRDNNQTGYVMQKYIEPTYRISNSTTTCESKPRPIIRLAELYLNLAECYAALGKNEEAIATLNPIRERAGIPALTIDDLSIMNAMDWVRNERFIELYGEGHRYYDVRRWMIAPEVMGAGVRKGLNAVEKLDPSFEEFNTPVAINQNFKWTDRMYLLPIFVNEVYKNPQMVQSPGY